MDAKVLAKVEGKEITELDVNRFLSELNPQIAMQFSTPEGKKQLVEELINQELIYLDAIDNKLDESPEFLKELEIMKQGLLKQYTIQQILKDVKVDEDEVKDYYEAHKEMFVKPESVKASHILVGTKEEANELKEKIEGGLEFAEAAMENSNCPSSAQGGNLGEFTKGQMVPEFEEAAFSLEVGTVSEPVETAHGFHLILVEEKNEESLSSLEEVKPQLKQQLLGMKQQEKYESVSNNLKEKYKVEVNM